MNIYTYICTGKSTLLSLDLYTTRTRMSYLLLSTHHQTELLTTLVLKVTVHVI